MLSSLLFFVFALMVCQSQGVRIYRPAYIPSYVRMTPLFTYRFYCDGEQENCESMQRRLNNTCYSISRIIAVKPNVYFNAYDDKLSKYGKTTDEVYAASFNKTDFTTINVKKENENYDYQNNVISPYPNSDKFRETTYDFHLVLNDFSDEGAKYSELNYDFENNYKKILLKTLAKFGVEYLKETKPPLPKECADRSNGVMDIKDKCGPIPKGGHVEDIKAILDNTFNATELNKVCIRNENECEKKRKNELYRIFNWKDYLISKGKKKYTTKLNYNRVIAVGDIHGDYQKLEDVLRHAKLIDSNNNWIATNTALVQTGDLMDRGSDIQKILDLLFSLKEQAKKKNSEVILLLGNHEVMNFRGNYQFVSLSDFNSFGSLSKREQAFSTSGKYGKIMRKEMKLTTAINDSIFVHGGLLPKFAVESIDDMNSKVQKILMNAPSFEEIYDLHQKNKTVEIYQTPYFSEEGPLFTRDLISKDEDELCASIEQTLKFTNTKRMIVGHNPQDYGEIRTRCNGKVIFIDLGMSSCYGNYFGYLEINNKNEIWARYKN